MKRSKLNLNVQAFDQKTTLKWFYLSIRTFPKFVQNDLKVQTVRNAQCFAINCKLARLRSSNRTYSSAI